jgi:hypothetical protein
MAFFRHIAAVLCDGGGVNTGRVVVVVTCVVVAGLGAWFAVARWDEANRVATVASALAAVGVVGIAIWAAVRTPAASPGPARSVTVSDTGNATADAGGRAVTGLTGTPGAASSIRVRRTGDARTSGEGDAITGAHLD